METTGPVTTTKECTACNEEKLLSEFVVDKTKLDGRTSQCKACRNARRKRKPIISDTPGSSVSSPLEGIISALKKFEQDFSEMSKEEVLYAEGNLISSLRTYVKGLQNPPVHVIEINSNRLLFITKQSEIIPYLGGKMREFLNHYRDDREVRIKIAVHPKADNLYIITLPKETKLNHEEVEIFESMVFSGVSCKPVKDADNKKVAQTDPVEQTWEMNAKEQFSQLVDRADYVRFRKVNHPQVDYQVLIRLKKPIPPVVYKLPEPPVDTSE
jgi:hypothetical protein